MPQCEGRGATEGLLVLRERSPKGTERGQHRRALGPNEHEASTRPSEARTVRNELLRHQ